MKMATNKLMRQLSLKLEPVRREFERREQKWAVKLIHSEIPADTSLFWRLPDYKVKNLQKTLGSRGEDRVRFFLEYHSRLARRKATARTVALSAEPVLRRCSNPSETDVQNHGFIPIPRFSPKLNRRSLLAAMTRHVEPVLACEVDRDPNDPGEWVYRTRFGDWQVLTVACTASPWQFHLEHDIRLGKGDLYIRRQISLHGVLGIGAGWNLVQLGEEDSVAQLTAEYCGFFLVALPELLAGLDSGISRKEVREAEREWKVWLEERQQARLERETQK